jgi:hypothetical protein
MTTNSEDENECDAVAWDKHREQQRRRYELPQVEEPTTERKSYHEPRRD